MLLRNPFFVENLWQDQPYASLLLVAPYCDLACEGCHNKDLKDTELHNYSIDELAEEYNSNPFIDGITVAGLEICLSGELFINDLILLIKKCNIKMVTIYSRFRLCDEKLREIKERLLLLNLEELYFKTGKYNSELPKKVVKIKDVEITLASCNQDFVRVLPC